MALYLQTNVASMVAQNNLSSTQNMMQTTFQRLSSGYRINSAADDAACIGNNGPSSRNTAIDMAIAMTTMICQVPEPIQEITRSPARMPTVTPLTSSTDRRQRLASDNPSETTAAIGAKNGRS